MNPILALWTPGTLVVAICCVISTFFIRSIAETSFPSLKAIYHSGTTAYLNGWARWWNQVILYGLPVITGGLLGTINSTWLWPTNTTPGVRVLLGIVIGWLSTLIYKVVRKAIKEKLQMDLPDVPSPVVPEEVPAEDRHTDPGPPPAPSIPPVAEEPSPATVKTGEAPPDELPAGIPTRTEDPTP